MNKKPHGTCRVAINPHTAKLRTRRRVKENGPVFDWYENLNRVDAILLRSPITGWAGWLPLEEIIISDVGTGPREDAAE
jgi:hypothetical protein